MVSSADDESALAARVVETVVPRLATALVEARECVDPDRATLDECDDAATLLVVRLLALALAEQRGLLPVDDDRYRPHSLATLAAELAGGGPSSADSPTVDEPAATTCWDAVTELCRAVHDGRDAWAVPAVGGRLFATGQGGLPGSDLLETVTLPDEQFLPALSPLLVANAASDPRLRDFGTVDSRLLGTVHERLLARELSVAREALARDGGAYAPLADTDAEQPAVAVGEPYYHDRSGRRKAQGGYYSADLIVDHLLDTTLDPALDAHLERVDALGDDRAADALFTFHVGDIAMGSGQFLRGALDRITDRFADYLDRRPLPGVSAALDRERAVALDGWPADAPEVLGGEQSLRWLVARRCLRGVDRDPLVTALARVTLWLDAGLPGRSLDAFDATLVAGDAVAGVGRRDELDVALPERSDTADGADDSTAAATEAVCDVASAARLDDDIDATDLPSLADVPDSTLHERTREVLDGVAPLHFPVAFPEVLGGERAGFDVLVGNPPWEEATVEVDEFWLRYEPGLRAISQGEREDRIERLRTERPDLVARLDRERATAERRRRFLREGPFPGMGTGDPDAYKAFAWRCWSLLRDGGRLGLVLPRSVCSAAGSEPLRRTWLDEGTVADCTFVVNRRNWAFPAVHPQYTIALASVTRTPPGDDAVLPLRGPFPDAESFAAGREGSAHRFPVEQARSWTDTAAFPLLPPDPAASGVFERLASAPRLDADRPGKWRARPYTELHATQDRTTPEGEPLIEFNDPPANAWPVLTGGSFDVWDPDAGEPYGWTDPEVLLPHLQAARERSYRHAGSRSAFAAFAEAWVEDQSTLPCRSARLAVRDVTRATDRRTVRPALVPPNVALTNKAPYFLWPRGDERDAAYLLGVLASVPLDWQARRFVETTLNFHILRSLPIPRPGRDSPLRERVVELAGRLAAVDDRYADWADAVGVNCGPVPQDQRRRHIHELDAVVAHLYGLSREQLRTVFETFHDGWDHEPRLAAVREHFEAWARRQQ